MSRTFDQISSSVVSGSSTNALTISSIPSTYTDLFVVGTLTLRNNLDGLTIYANGLNVNQYSWISLRSTGTAASSHTYSNRGNVYIGDHVTGIVVGAQTFSIHIMSYSNTNIFKTFLVEYAHPSSMLYRTVGTFRDTSAINSLTVNTAFAGGDRINVYGVKSA